MFTRRHIAIASLEMLFRQTVSLVAVFLLARILNPQDYGQFAPVYLLIAVASALSDMGIGAAVVRHHSFGHEAESTAFWLNVGLALSAGVVFTLSFYVLNRDASNGALALYVGASMLGVVLGSTGTVHLARLLRAAQFSRLFALTVIASTVSLVVSIGIAVSGGGVWALVAQLGMSSALTGVGSWLISPWRPAFVFNMGDVRRYLDYGVYLTLAGVVNAAYRNLLAVLFLRSHGQTWAGLYTAADRLQSAAADFLVSLSSRLAFVKFVFAEPGRLAVRAFSNSLMALSMISVIGFSILCHLDAVVVGLALGPKWDDAVPIFGALSVAGCLWPLEVHCQNVIKAKGTARQFFYLELSKRAIGVAILWSLMTQPAMVSVYMVVALSLVFFLTNAIVAARLLQIRLVSAMRPLAPAATTALGTWGVLKAVVPDQGSSFMQSILTVTATVLVVSLVTLSAFRRIKGFEGINDIYRFIIGDSNAK